jgi:hypothetical protein
LIGFAQTDGGSAGKLLLGLSAAGENPRDFAGTDWVALLTAQLGDDGAMNIATPFGQSLAILGLAAASEPVPPAAADWLLARQSSDEGLDGSWEDGFGTLGNSDSTAMAIMALLAAGYGQRRSRAQPRRRFFDQHTIPGRGLGIRRRLRRQCQQHGRRCPGAQRPRHRLLL